MTNKTIIHRDAYSDITVVHIEKEIKDYVWYVGSHNCFNDKDNRTPNFYEVESIMKQIGPDGEAEMTLLSSKVISIEDATEVLNG